MGGGPLRCARWKTSQLAAALQGQGLLLANEFVAARAEILRQNLERMGVTNAVITNEDTANLAKALPGQFDRVLVDAPCSGEGMFRKEAVAAAQHSDALVAHCAELGAEILENAAALLARVACWSTRPAPLPRRRTRRRSQPFLQSTPSSPSATCPAAALAARAKQTAPRTTRISTPNIPPHLPADGGEGHFMAKLQKAADAEVPNQPKVKPPKAVKPPAEWLEFAKAYFPALASRPLAGAGEWLLLPAPGSEG